MKFSARLQIAVCGIVCLFAGCSTVPTVVQNWRSKSIWAEKSTESKQFHSRDESDDTVDLTAVNTDVAPQLEPPLDRTTVAKKVSLSPDLKIDHGPASSKSRKSQPSESSPTARLRHADHAQDRPLRFGEAFLVASSNQEDSESTEDLETSEPVPPSPTDDGEAVEAISELPAAYSLSLGNILFLADAQNPNIGFARERIQEAYARVDRAGALWLPSIRSGLNYFHHEGNVQDVVGNVFSTNKSAFYGGLGAGGSGSGSPIIPGVVAQFHLTDAIFQPRITGHQAASRQFAATATRNDFLRNAAVAYLELMRAEQALAISDEALTNTKELVRLTGEYARTGQGLRADYERMLAEQAVREADLLTRIEGIKVASARLAQLLHADPSIRIASNEPAVVPVPLLDGNQPPAAFVATGLIRRPELAEQKHLVCEAVERLRREKFAPLVPSVLLATSYAGMGGGLGNNIINADDRWDSDAMAFWEIRNFGIGERAARNEMSSLVRQAQQKELVILDQVAREVVEAHAQVVERERRIVAARSGIESAERSFQLNEDRIKNAQGLPIESLQAVQALALARLTYLNAVIDYNVAQFELCRATGWFESESPDTVLIE